MSHSSACVHLIWYTYLHTHTSVLNTQVTRCLCMHTHVRGNKRSLCAVCSVGRISVILCGWQPTIPAAPAPSIGLTRAVARAAPVSPGAGTLSPGRGTALTPTARGQALPLRSPARSWGLRPLSEWWEESIEFSASFLPRCCRLSSSIFSLKVHNHSPVFPRAGAGSKWLPRISTALQGSRSLQAGLSGSPTPPPLGPPHRLAARAGGLQGTQGWTPPKPHRAPFTGPQCSGRTLHYLSPKRSSLSVPGRPVGE